MSRGAARKAVAAGSRLGGLVRMALAGDGAVYVEVSHANGHASVAVQLRKDGAAVMEVVERQGSVGEARGYVAALSTILGGRVFVEDRGDTGQDYNAPGEDYGPVVGPDGKASAATKAMFGADNDRVVEALATIAAHNDEVAIELTEKIKAWVCERLGRPMSDDGGTAFYTPSEWKVRGEEFGEHASLVIVHDGGDLAVFCNYDYGAYEDIEAFSAFLGGLGYYCEGQTCWYSGIYPVAVGS